MSLQPWDPWNELERVRMESERLWDHFLGKLRPEDDPEGAHIAFLPDLDVIETRDDYRLYLSAPGFVEEDLEILVDEHSLVVRGERYPPYDPQRADNRLAEWRYGYFERRVKLPRRIHAGQVKATYDAGVLTIVVDKS